MALRKTIIIKNGYSNVIKIRPKVFSDSHKCIYASGGLRVGYELFIIIDNKRYPIQWDGNNLFVEMIGMTKESWEKYNYDQLISDDVISTSVYAQLRRKSKEE